MDLLSLDGVTADDVACALILVLSIPTVYLAAFLFGGAA